MKKDVMIVTGAGQIGMASCGKCKKVCPMNVDVTDNSRKSLNGTECILCMECVRNCPKDAL